MIVDFHTHVFPAEVREQRDDYLRRDIAFRELYASPKARIATADELLVSMDGAGIDRSVICGFAWSDADLCRRHNDALLEAAAHSGDRLIPFCTVQLSDPGVRDEIARCATGGARGLGELRPASQGADLTAPEGALLAQAAQEHGLPLLFHASEPVGHGYPGKGGSPIGQLYRFAAANPDVEIIAAHWGGGLPFYTMMPEVRAALARTSFDTAASGLLYQRDVYVRVVQLVGVERIVFGSDFPLVPQERALAELRAATIGEETRRLIEGGNAIRLLRLADG